MGSDQRPCIRNRFVTGTRLTIDTDVSIVLGSGSWGELQANQLFRQTYVPAYAPALVARTPCDTIEQLNGHTLLVHQAHEDAWNR
jgi:LysR family transcriptional regulator, glycine cleavage system transcriptional activator